MVPQRWVTVIVLWLSFGARLTRPTRGLAVAVDASPRSVDNDDKAQLSPIVLTSRNFGSHIGDGNKWLVEIYAPWCGHCRSFEPVYEEISEYFHSQPKKKVKIGKINGDAEQALSSRFAIKAYPSFYLIHGFTVYKYEGNRSYSSIVNFIEDGFRKESPISIFSSPMGPVGLLQGTCLAMGYGAFDTLEWLQNKLGVSALFAGMILFGSCFIGIFVSIVVVAVLFTPKEKRD